MTGQPVPLFPLGTVLVPGAPLPLRIFEDRYRAMVSDLLQSSPEEPSFGVVAIREGHEVGEGGARALYEVGCLARITEVDEMDDGNLALSTTGTTRFRLGKIDHDKPYQQAVITELPEVVGEVGQLVSAVHRGYAGYRDSLRAASRQALAEPVLPDDPTMLSYVVAATVVADTADRQSFLELLTSGERLRAERRWLHREAELLRRLSAVPASGLLNVPLGLS